MAACRLPILHIPLTLNRAAMLEWDFLRPLRFLDLGTLHPPSWIAHALVLVACGI
jgi:hypothetical protein